MYLVSLSNRYITIHDVENKKDVLELETPNVPSLGLQPSPVCGVWTSKKEFVVAMTCRFFVRYRVKYSKKEKDALLDKLYEEWKQLNTSFFVKPSIRHLSSDVMPVFTEDGVVSGPEIIATIISSVIKTTGDYKTSVLLKNDMQRLNLYSTPGDIKTLLHTLSDPVKMSRSIRVIPNDLQIFVDSAERTKAQSLIKKEGFKRRFFMFMKKFIKNMYYNTKQRNILKIR